MIHYPIMVLAMRMHLCRRKLRILEKYIFLVIMTSFFEMLPRPEIGLKRLNVNLAICPKPPPQLTTFFTHFTYIYVTQGPSMTTLKFSIPPDLTLFCLSHIFKEFFTSLKSTVHTRSWCFVLLSLR